MSIHVMSWVLRNSNATLGDRLVLIVLADHAREDGTSAWPSLETIAHQAKLSERQARRCLRNLEASGEIRETGRSRKGTHIYEFPLYQKGDNMTPLGGTNRAGGGDMMTPDPSLEQPSVVLAKTVPKDQRDEVWDTLTDIFGPALTRSAETLRGKHVASLAEAGATREEIIKRAKSWPSHFDSATLTAAALEKHWDTLGRPPLRRTG
jgi:hypothetical protein